VTNHIEQIWESDDRLVVELSYKRVEQFFDSDDPSIINQRDLSEDAEKALFYSIIDRESDKPVEYIVRFPESQVTPEVEAGLPDAVKTYFRYRSEGARRDLRIILKRIKYGLLIGLALSTVLLIVGFYLFSQHTNDVFGQVIVGSIVIFCWVALWDPIDVFLHQYLIQKGIIRIGEKRILHCTVRVETARTGPDGMPVPGNNPKESKINN
jgi:hypothetical protein